MVGAMARKLGIPVAILLVVLALAAGWWIKRANDEAALRAGAERRFGISRADVSAPAATVLLEDGRTLALSQLRGEVVFLNFWATWCPPCRDEMPSMLGLGRDLARAHPGRFRMVAVSVDEGWEEIRSFFQGQLPPEATIALDPDYVATRAYYCGARGKCPESLKFPETYIIDAQGRLVAYMVGPRDWADPAARAFLEGLIRG
jgi:thiol-disulfide isomerase/thioredoxin